MLRQLSAVFVLVVAAFAAPVHAQSSDEARVLRFPTIHSGTIVFSYAGDLYAVASAGGVARKLTTHEGMELFPKFSPDGSKIAFTGQYDGNTEVYVMPAQGGVPTRITYTATLGRDDVTDRMGPNNIVMDWSHDGTAVTFRSRMRTFNDFIGSLYSAPLTGDLPTEIPVPRGGFMSYSDDGKKMAYNRVFREFRTWKRYRGGMADDIWVFDFETKSIENITNNLQQDIIPMWKGTSIYYLSDRDASEKMNLFVYDTVTKQTRQLTRFTDFDIKFPSIGDNAIVFEQGGWLWRYDLAGTQPVRVPVVIREDFASARGGLISVKDNIAGGSISPDGNRVIFSARGDLFSVPAKSGITRNLTNSSGAHDRNAAWSPDGKSIAYISDASGSDEVWMVAQDGSSAPVQLTTAGGTYKFELAWSPDSKHILFSDRSMSLFLLNVATKQVTLVDKAETWDFREFTWSPDSKWIAYQRPEYLTNGRVMLYSVDQKKTWPVTDTWYNSGSPSFSRDGKYLFFISSRDFNPTYSWTEWNHAYTDMARIYFVTLKKDLASPFAPKHDEVNAVVPAAAAPVTGVDVEGLANRVGVLPIPASNYYALTALNDVVYYMRNGASDAQAQFFRYDLAEQKETNLGNIGGYQVSGDGKKFLVSRQGGWSVIDAPKGTVDLSTKVDVGGLQLTLDRRAEWMQIFNENWRHMNDFFYDPNMHGVDWAATRDAYRPWIDGIQSRADLTYILGEMIGELNAGHAYVGGGDFPTAERVPMGLLGANLERDRSGYVKISKILRGENWIANRRSPLTEVGVNVAEGEFIIAVNGKPVNAMTNIQAALINTVNKPVVLTVNSRPTPQGARDVTVKPIGDESQLRYYNWVMDNIAKVDKATNGRVGYIHVPNMGPTGLNEFIKFYYPQLNKEALIIDVRGNGGGNVSPMLIERLRREAIMANRARDRRAAPNPAGTMMGPMITLLDEFSASDGDLFPYRFRASGLGKLVGKRSWGGVVGVWGSLPFVDGGTMQKPESAPYAIDGSAWIIEGHGVDPDIIVDNDPHKEYTGTDQQLLRGIEEILKELPNAQKLPAPPPYPNKSNRN
jgi:tricorn protease